MRYLKVNLIAVSLIITLLSCTNSKGAANTTVILPVDNAVSRTIITDIRTVGEWANDGHADSSYNYPLS